MDTLEYTDHTQHQLLRDNAIYLELGRTLITPGAKATVEERHGHRAGPVITSLILRHLWGDWSEMSADDARANLRGALATGEDATRIFSAYHLPALPGESEALEDRIKVWIITEWDRSYTTFLLPEEY